MVYLLESHKKEREKQRSIQIGDGCGFSKTEERYQSRDLSASMTLSLLEI
jgi:hypothetical protein